ncbi:MULTISPECIES: mechanosensitive ion channel family protein [Zunongwangia]|jgi:miniconductance mechanosensitive channel|uniref:mechanosensitive ion channel family protein n=2 Tax=Flavobacteriaceae TaxID=49546 RepID=UPI000C988158|nr:mechanosensitive ion channel domain-containing protein [Zunongwangia profunda]MAG87521.1 mechanosensitive ion channel protein MscS [Flavobacteriaceae bacterium]MCC4228419.1 mechanosensitive ion channel family protein [Zunongwangia profunda]|tara:strand:- start:480 stop:1769 length:1290 start_codon:yes stop_codon:yes gene_type:complete
MIQLNEDIKQLSCLLEDFLLKNGVNYNIAHYANLLLNILVLILIILGINYLIKRFVIQTFKTFTDKTKTTFDDFLIQSNFPRYVGQILPLMALYYLMPIIFVDYSAILAIFDKLFDLYVIILVVWICRSILRTSKHYLKTLRQFNDKPVDSYIQVVMILVWVIGLMFIFAEITGESVRSFIISLGAASAVLILVFKDTILGFVASIQVAVNDIVRIGDWITFDKYGADGNVTEISLATVRVQNWDNTFTTIPTYSLISESFQNWRGMQESPGRRIKRAVYIKQNSVKFMTSENLEELKKVALIKKYITSRQEEIDKFNTENNIDKSLPLNGRNQTNLGIFRKYVDSYLNEHSAIHKELYIIVRHQAPTDKGIPIEILCFSRDKRWENFEYITADIFDHVIAAIPYFGLQLFESPSGDDITKLYGFQQEN